jgi:hypothetical protein
MPSPGRMALGVLLSIPSLGTLRVRPGNVTLPNTAGVKAFLPGFHSPESGKDGKS